ncbi:MAG: YigZ family protein [Bacteroidales bacterium]
MEQSDTYKTIKSSSKGLFKDKGSKFIALAYPANTVDEAEQWLVQVKNEYHDARHHCYAYAIGFNRESYRMNDDGEPSGTAGKPIYGQILSHDLTNVIIVVVRYFGGTKLGVRGLINAYKGSSREALSNGTIVQKTIRNHYRVSFNYPAMNDVMRIMKEYDLPQLSHDFAMSCSLDFSVRLREAEDVIARLEQIPDVQTTLL